jgi:hypothetical protein
MFLCGEINPACKWKKVWLNYFLNIEMYIFVCLFVHYGPDYCTEVGTYLNSEIEVRMVIPVSGQRILKHSNHN